MNENILSLCDFRSLIGADISLIADAIAALKWNKPVSNPESIYNQYLKEQTENKRCVWTAWIGDSFVGYVTLKWFSDYQPFATCNIPEINDLNVLPKFRQQGIGSKLLDLAETEANKRSSCVGLGVGLYADYGEAQKLYIKRGYIPDGRGLTYKNKSVLPGETVQVDDDLTLWLVKKVQQTTV
jgi:GNAT superfamily N-acetyltransferase